MEIVRLITTDLEGLHVGPGDKAGEVLIKLDNGDIVTIEFKDIKDTKLCKN